MANLSNINGKFVVEQTTGYVGIGTTDPNFLIEAAGTNAELALNASSIYRVRSTSNDEFIITKNGVGDRLTISGGGDATFTGNVKLTDEKILALRSTSNDYAIQYRDLDFRFIGSADGTTQRKFSFGYYTSDNPAGTWNGKVYINSYTGDVGIGTGSPLSKLHTEGVLTIKGSDTATNGSLAIQDNYSGANHLGNIGWNRSSGGPYFSYGLKQDGSADWKSTFANFSGKRTFARLDEDSFTFGFAPAQNTAVDSVVTNVTEKIKFNLEDTRLGIGYTSPASVLHVGSTGANAYSATITKGSNMKGIINTLSNNADDMVGIYFATGSTTEGTHWSGITGSRSDNANHWGTQLNFYTHNNDVANLNDATQKMVIKGDGNVGIGTTSPDSILHVNGYRLRLGDGASDSKLWGTPATGGNFLIGQSSSTGKIKFVSSADSDLMTILNDGKVGINNTAPASKLNVNGNDNGSAEYSVTLGSTTTAGGTANNASSTPVNKTLLTGYSIPYSGQTNSRLTTCGFLEFASTAGWTGSQRTWAITSGYDIGGQDSGAGGNKMAIILGNAQNVSPQIGTNGAIGESGDGDGANSLVACYWDNALNMRLADSGRLYTGGGGSAALPMITPGTDKNTGIWYPTSDTWALSTAGEERMRINSSGNVGIGTTGPSAKMHVVNNSTSVDTAIFESSASSSHDCVVAIKSPRDSYLIFQPANTNKWAIIADYPSTGDFDIYNYPNNFDSMTFKDNKNIITNMSGGNFGIGTTGPSYKLDVNGTIRATGDVIAYSDERVKENIKTIDNSLEKVNKLRGVEFNKKGEDKKSIGVIAQEIEKILPEVVSTDDNGMKSVAYGNITGVLIEAIKELKAEIEELKKHSCDCKK